MAALVKTLYKTAQQTAQATARAAAAQGSETLKTAQDQVGLRPLEDHELAEQTQAPAVVQSIRDQGVSAIDREGIHKQEQAMLASLEDQLKGIRVRREKEQEAYTQTVAQEMQAQSAPAAAESFAPPQGKLRKALGNAKKKVQSMLTSRKQGESKQGTGKG